MTNEYIPLRKDVPASDKWDLSKIYASDADWETALNDVPRLTAALSAYKGRLAESPETLLAALKADEALGRQIEDVYHYASLLHSADQGDSSAQEKENRAIMALTQVEAALSFYTPEIIAIPDEKIDAWLKGEAFAPYRVYIKKIRHLKPYTLSEKEERILALQKESGQTAENAFSLLNNVDLNFGTIAVDGVDKPLTQSTWSTFMQNHDRDIRKKTYTQFYGTFESHANTLAALYAGSVNNDVFVARARGYKSSLEAALYQDKVSPAVYRNLIDTVHKNLDTLHRYYALRKRVLGLSELRHYDVYVPLVASVHQKTSYEEAVEIVRNALAPLGKEYTDTLCGGLLGGWCDRYENKGKRSGAFSSGCYRGYPYILLNYKDDSIRDVYTMAHEGGHSMHSWYSVHNNPYPCYSYTIFEAEVASTFNEELVFEYLLKEAKAKGNRELVLYLLSMRSSDILATLYRQTMFAEYELKAHEAVENGQPLSTDVLRSIYRTLLEQYFGPDTRFESNSDMEGLRIPHFYSAFYVYKYATGISASLALAKRVTQGGAAEREDYFKFLKSGGSRYPMESLRMAGVNMESAEPVQAALDTFRELLEQLEEGLK